MKHDDISIGMWIIIFFVLLLIALGNYILIHPKRLKIA